MSLLDNLPNTAKAYKRTRTRDSLGGSKDTYSVVVFESKACWLQPASDREITQYAKRTISVTNKVYFVEPPHLDDTHLLVISGQSYKVQSSASPDASAGLGVLWRVMVELVGGDVPA